MPYIAIICDLIASKRITDRGAVQAQLQRAMSTVNDAYASEFASKFTITLGDEFQALLHPTPRLFELLDRLELETKGIDFRTGIGYGDITTAIDPERAIGADGSAYWNARMAIESVHDENDYGKTHTRFIGFDPLTDAVVNDNLAMSDHLKASWSHVQWQTFRTILDSGVYRGEFEQKRIAKLLDITQQTLTSRLMLSAIKVYLRSRDQLGRFLYEKAVSCKERGGAL